MSNTITIAEHDPRWAELYTREARRIEDALDARALRIEHVGSTSVPGLAAKPVIDVLLAVADSTHEASYLDDLTAAGYLFRFREPHWHEHRFLKRSDPVVNLHVFSAGCPEIDRMLLFRDWLRANRGDRELYERTKRELARREWNDTQDYADAKTAVVEQILARARSVSDSSRRNPNTLLSP